MQACLKQWFSHFVIRSVCDRFLLPSRSQRKSPHSSPDLCSSHWRGHWSCRRCLHTDRQEAWCHFLMSETQLTKLWTIRVRFKLHIIAKNAAISEGQRIFVYFRYWQNKWLSLWIKGLVHPKLQLSHWCHMDYFTDVLATFLCIDHWWYPCCLWRVRELSDLIKNILICVLKMNKCLMGLERHEGD